MAYGSETYCKLVFTVSSSVIVPRDDLPPRPPRWCPAFFPQQLESASSYRILSSSGCITLEGVDDADRFSAIQDAFTTVGVDSDAQMQVGVNFYWSREGGGWR